MLFTGFIQGACQFLRLVRGLTLFVLCFAFFFCGFMGFVGFGMEDSRLQAFGHGLRKFKTRGGDPSIGQEDLARPPGISNMVWGSPPSDLF